MPSRLRHSAFPAHVQASELLHEVSTSLSLAAQHLHLWNLPALDPLLGDAVNVACIQEDLPGLHTHHLVV